MWTLVAIVMVMVSAEQAHVYLATSNLKFDDVQQCEEWRASPEHEVALENLREQTSLRYSNNTFSIKTRCVKPD